jgi:hypothetical protein
MFLVRQTCYPVNHCSLRQERRCLQRLCVCQREALIDQRFFQSQDLPYKYVMHGREQ